VDALAAGALKALLGRMTERGTTIFLTSHVLEIVERLCSHVAIIHKGRLVAQGSLDELRAGVAGAEGSQTTLEQIFLSIVGQEGVSRPQLEELSWLM
jgi:ABC-2 type transport system ATP-binding protein